MTEERKDLANKYRPLNFDELIGWETGKKSLLSVLNTKRTYLLHGPRGCGKTTIGRLIAYELDTDDMDIKEIDAASNNGVDEAREIKKNAMFSPLKSKNKVYIIDECHRLTGNAEDALLKLLEEPPMHCYFILCTTELEKIRATIKSRAAKYEVKPLDEPQSNRLLDWVCKEEKIEISKVIKNAIIEKSEGIPREMLVSLDMVKGIKDDQEAIDLIYSASGNKQVIDLCRALLKREQWDVMKTILKSIVEEPESVRYAVLGYMNAVLMNKYDAQALLIIELFRESFMYSKKAGLTYACYEAIR